MEEKKKAKLIIPNSVQTTASEIRLQRESKITLGTLINNYHKRKDYPFCIEYSSLGKEQLGSRI